MDKKQRTVEEAFKRMNYEISRRTWLYKIGFRETHMILYFIEYGVWRGLDDK